jgi:hypothetical protein
MPITTPFNVLSGGAASGVPSGTSPVGTLGITAGQVAYGDTTANTIKGEAAFLYTEATNLLTIGQLATEGLTIGAVAATNCSITSTTGNSLTLATLDGNKNVIVAPHGTGVTQVNGTGINSLFVNNTNATTGITSNFPANMTAGIGNLSATNGGALITGLSVGGNVPVYLYGVIGTSGSGTPVIQFQAEKKSGTSTSSLASGDLVARFANYNVNLIHVYGNGDLTPAATLAPSLGTSSLVWKQLFLGPLGAKLGDGTNGPSITATGSSPNEFLVATIPGAGEFSVVNNASGATARYQNLSSSGYSAFSFLTSASGFGGSIGYANSGVGAGPTASSIFINTSGASIPITFSINEVEKARVTPNGGIALGATTDPGAGNFLVTGRVDLGGASATNGAIADSTVSGGWGIGLPSAANTNGQQVRIEQVTELTTIAAAATTDTTIQIPANAIVIGVDVRVTVAITCTSTFDYGVAGATTRYGTAISKAVNTTNAGTNDGTRYYGSAISIRFTPDTVPSDATGRVRTTIHYIAITPATS